MKTFTKKERSPCSASDDSPPQRPKRNTCQKNFGVSNGLLWREETDLKRALYASLQETKKKNWEEDGEENLDEVEKTTVEMPESENSQEESPKKAKVHAQRKFAQCSTPNSPVPTPMKVPYVNNSATELLPYRRPKTEDFLTFLCLRGTSILPPSLDFLNSCSKSDTSSECRSLSPELDLKEYSGVKEANSVKNLEVKDKTNSKNENGDSTVLRKHSACKASSRRHSDTLQSVKKLQSVTSKLNKEVPALKKKKVKNVTQSVPYNVSSSRLKSASNTRTRSNTALHALREKYKKQRLASDKKKLLPVKNASTPASSNSKDKGLTTRSQTIQKQGKEHKTAKVVTRNQIKLCHSSVSKIKKSKIDRRLAIEKRRSLRSANPTRDIIHRRFSPVNNKTPWLRRAKLVPPIVDVESDSEPEIIIASPIKKVPVPTVSQKPENISEETNHLSERLRNKRDISKVQPRLTSRQMLLRKHMRNRLKAKKSLLQTKNVRSKAIVKQTAKQTILKKVRKNLVMKTMSLRKDLQNKRVTRSAKHQIQEMFWSNPEKRSKLQNQKPIQLTKSEKKHGLHENHPVSKKKKIIPVPKEKESACVVKEKESTLAAKEKEKENTKLVKCRVKESVKRKAQSLAIDTKSPSITAEATRTPKQNGTPKLAPKLKDNVKHTRSSKSLSSISDKSHASGNVKAIPVLPKTKTENNTSQIKTSKSDPGKSEENRSRDLATQGHAKVTNFSNIKSGNNNHAKNNFLENEDNSKVITEKDSKIGKKINVPANAKNDLGNKDFVDGMEDKKEVNVQNNLNLLNPEKNNNKDISQLIGLNVECEETSFNVNFDPCCSGFPRNIKEERLNFENTSKEDNVKNELKINKKHSDKKSKKLVKEDLKPSRKETEKHPKLSKRNIDKAGIKAHKKDSDKGKENKDVSEISKDVRKITDKAHKKESSKCKIENVKDGLENAEEGKQASILNNKKHLVKEKIENSTSFSDICKEKRVCDEMHKDKTEISWPESEIDVKINKTSSRRDDFPPKPAKSDVRKESYESSCSGKSTEKGNSKDINKEKTENFKHSDKKVKPNSSILSNTVIGYDTESDEDSDYDITLDHFLKLKSEANSTSKSESFSVAAGTSKTELNNEDKTNFNEIKNVKYAKREFEKDSQKIKKESDSSKHKKEKDTSKNKSHDKESKTLKKEEKISKKDAEKSLAKLLKKERDREKSKSSKKEDKYKHKKDGSGSSKLSKKEYEKDGSKLSKKEPEKETLLEKQSDINEFSEGKKDKASKKESSKLSRSNSCEETKSPKKKKKHNEFKDIEKIKNLISKSSILNEFSGFKEFKRRSSSDKSELKKHLSKSKKRKKLALLKQKKLSKKLSAKLLRKYSKKKGLKSKKNKLKKKELKKEIKLTGLNNKIHSKSKKQKHKTKGDHHRRDSQDKIKDVELSASISTSNNSVLESSQYISKAPNDSECHKNADTKVLNNNVQTCTNEVSTASTYVIESVPESIPSIETISAEAPQPISADLVFGAGEELQGIMSSEFTGVFDETFPPGAILLATRDSISQVPLHFIQDLSIPKTMADAATNTGEDDIDESMSLISEPLKSEEMSVGTQTITPAGSPSPTIEVKPLIQVQSVESPVEDKAKSGVSEENDLAATSEKIQEKEPVVIPSPSKSKTLNPSLPSKNPLPPKVKKRSYVLKKFKSVTNASLPKLESFPLDTPKLVSAPVYHPTIEEFRDPLEYICKIHEEAGKYGICKIVPPPSFKPECKVNDDMRFTAHNQYVHKMLYRWGPNVQHTACLKKHLKSQKVKLEQAPLIGGIELDVSKFYHTVQMFGGLQQVIEKKKWQRVADGLRVPKTAQDRVTKLYDAYCKYLVSYDTLPPEEKQKIEEEVISDHERRMKSSSASKDAEKDDEDLDDDENNDCVTKGRSMSLSNFFRIARNTMSMWFKNDPSPEEVEHEFWKLVTERNHHVVVHAGNIDSSVYQSGFPCNRNSPFAKHPWNLKILTNNSNSILRSMGPVSGITIPTLHVGMLFTTGCWYRDPHSLPWIEYLHTGASKIWYGIPANACEKFRQAMKKIMPEYCTNNPIWLPSDTAMVPPDLLVKHGASLSRTIQNSGQFVVIFPESFTSTICCGYCVSESVYFAPTPWLDRAVKAFQDIQNSCEPTAFSLERLLFSIGNDPKAQLETLQKILPMIKEIRHQEMSLRLQLSDLGLKQFERLPLLEIRDKKRKFRGIEDESEQECEICRTHCYVSMVLYTQEDSIYCLSHALECIPKKNLKSCKLMYTYNENELNELVKRIDELIAEQLSKQCARKKSPKKKLLAVPDK